MLGQGGLIAEIDKVPRTKVRKITRVLWSFYGTSVGVYLDTMKIDLIKPSLTYALQSEAKT